MKELEKKIRKCRRCSLWKGRKNPVPGEGNPKAKIVLVGLGPGKDEDREGRPFVGAAGKLLNKLFQLAGLKREEIYITNIIKCYLPENKATKEQIKACTQFLDQQIALIRPRTIVSLGNIATSYLFRKFSLKEERMELIRGKIFEAKADFGKVKIIPMYHPAASLRNPGMRARLLKDWKGVRRKMR
jgi:DNA polymerase